MRRGEDLNLRKAATRIIAVEIMPTKPRKVVASPVKSNVEMFIVGCR